MTRWPIIRHVRWLWHTWRATRWARAWGEVGIGLGIINESDQRALDAIWRGER